MANFFTKHFNFLSQTNLAEDFEAILGSVIKTNAIKQLALHIATSYIANALAGCEIKVFKGGEEVHDHLYYRLNVSPNPNQSAVQFRNALAVKLCMASDALVIPYRSDSLYLADSFSVDKRPLKDFVFAGVTVEEEQLKKNYKASDVYYFSLDSPSIKHLVTSVYDDYSKLLAAAVQGFIKEHGYKYKLEIANKRAGDEQFTQLYNTVIKDQLKEFIDSETAVYPQFEGYNLIEMSQSNSKSSADDVIKLRKEVFEFVAQAYKIPVSMMYGNTNNTDDVVKQFLTFGVDTPAKMISNELTRKSFTEDEWRAGCLIEVDTKSISHVDIFEVAAQVDKLVSSGALNIDDIRCALGYQPLGTDFSRAHYITKNYALAEEGLTNLGDGGGEN